MDQNESRRRSRGELTPYGILRSLLEQEGILSEAFSMPFGFSPSFRADVKETDKEYIIEAELPGVKKEQVSVEYEDGFLTISARQEEELQEENEDYIRRERRWGELKRSFFADNVDESAIRADHKNGILTVYLPKTEIKNSRRKNIAID